MGQFVRSTLMLTDERASGIKTRLYIEKRISKRISNAGIKLLGSTFFPYSVRSVFYPNTQSNKK